jgi:uncharacterized membrane protein
MEKIIEWLFNYWLWGTGIAIAFNVLWWVTKLFISAIEDSNPHKHN